MKFKPGKLKKIVLNKQVLLSVLALTVVVAGVVNWKTKNNDSVKTSAPGMEVYGYEDEDVVYDAVEAGAQSDFFSKQRMENEAARGKELEINKEILNNQNSSQESRTNAENEIARIARSVESENSSESLIRAKGYDDALVMVGSDTVTVIVKTEKLQAEDVAVIKDIIVGQTGYSADKIKISEMN